MYKGYYVIDAHCHIYPEKIAAKAAGATDKFYDIKGYGKGTVKDLKRVCKRDGVDHAIVQSVATTPKQVKSINEFISDEVKNSKGFLTGLGTLHPDSEDIKGDITHIVELGLKGVKLHPDIQKFKVDGEKLFKIYEICEEKNLTMLVHTGDYRCVVIANVACSEHKLKRHTTIHTMFKRFQRNGKQRTSFGNKRTIAISILFPSIVGKSKVIPHTLILGRVRRTCLG